METKTLIFSFTAAIQNKNTVLVKFQSKSNNEVLLRKCAPLDIAPSKRSKNKVFKFHLWDFDSGKKSHILSLEPDQILDLSINEEQFKPEEFVVWNTATTPWCVVRDWGVYS